ncbi:MAG: hypothetical protein EAX87_12355 [Candidatus Thorarchaeota archaeon]|nr:hypothetical protein [Candidatus Thorarchaeota archaeon]
MAMYMLYRSCSKSAKDMNDLRMKFEDIYNKYDVDIVGFWVNANDENELYYLSKYDDENDYKMKVERLRKDEEYVRLSKELNEVRTSIETTKLLPMMAGA